MKERVKNFFKSIKPVEWTMWAVSTVIIVASFFVFKNTQYHYLVGSLIGVSALVFTSKGNPIGQGLIIVFGVFYGIISFSFKYYGEMITYLGMSVPIAVFALVSWIKNPFAGNKSEVKVNTLSKKEWAIFSVAVVAVTAVFFFILRALGTNNLIVSTISVATSFAAAYLTARRNRFYAIGYMLNDIVLIVLWSLASTSDITYLPMTICFSAFFMLDLYGFVNWSRMTKRQRAKGKELYGLRFGKTERRMRCVRHNFTRADSLRGTECGGAFGASTPRAGGRGYRSVRRRRR